MKRLFLLIGVCLASVMANAQNVNPRGLFKWTKVSFDGNHPEVTPEFDQYKYCTDSISVQMVIRRDVTTPKVDFQMSVLQNDSKPFNYTGDVPVGYDGKGSRVFDSDGKSFKFKWYNNILPRDKMFPYKEFVTEHYSVQNLDPRIVRCFDLCKMKLKGNKNKNRLFGCWYRVGSFSKIDNMDVLIPCPDELYKVYDEDVYFHAYNIGGPYQIRMYFILRPVKYKGADTVEEFGEDCTIKWIDDNTYHLSYKGDNGETVTELWKRSGFPTYVQKKLCGTDLPVFELKNPVPRRF